MRGRCGILCIAFTGRHGVEPLIIRQPAQFDLVKRGSQRLIFPVETSVNPTIQNSFVRPNAHDGRFAPDHAGRRQQAGGFIAQHVGRIVGETGYRCAHDHRTTGQCEQIRYGMMHGPMFWIVMIGVGNGHFDHIKILLQKRHRFRFAVMADQKTNIWLAPDNSMHHPFMPPKRNGGKQRLVQIVNLFGKQGEIAPTEMHSHHGPGTEPLKNCCDLFCERRAKAEPGRGLVMDVRHLIPRSAEPPQDDFPACGEVLKKLKAAIPHPDSSPPPPEADAPASRARDLKGVQFRPVQYDFVSERPLNSAGQDKCFQPVAQSKTIVDIDLVPQSVHNHNTPIYAHCPRPGAISRWCIFRRKNISKYCLH